MLLNSINFDGSEVDFQIAAEFVIRYSNGSPIVVGARNLGEGTIYVAEALALRDGLRYAKVESFKIVCVEGDSKLIINSIFE